MRAHEVRSEDARKRKGEGGRAGEGTGGGGGGGAGGTYLDVLRAAEESKEPGDAQHTEDRKA